MLEYSDFFGWLQSMQAKEDEAIEVSSTYAATSHYAQNASSPFFSFSLAGHVATPWERSAFPLAPWNMLSKNQLRICISTFAIFQHCEKPPWSGRLPTLPRCSSTRGSLSSAQLVHCSWLGTSSSKNHWPKPETRCLMPFLEKQQSCLLKNLFPTLIKQKKLFHWNRAVTYRLCTLFPNSLVELLLPCKCAANLAANPPVVLALYKVKCTKNPNSVENTEKPRENMCPEDLFSTIATSSVPLKSAPLDISELGSLLHHPLFCLPKRLYKSWKQGQWKPIFCWFLATFSRKQHSAERCWRFLKQVVCTMPNSRYTLMNFLVERGKQLSNKLPRTCDGCPGIFWRVFDQAACCSYLRNSSCWTKQGIARQSLFYAMPLIILLWRCGGHQPKWIFAWTMTSTKTNTKHL